MTTVICNVEKCPYRSKRPSRKYTTSDGKNLYVCGLDMIVISNLFDPDGETFGLFGYTPAECCFYGRKREEENEKV